MDAVIVATTRDIPGGSLPSTINIRSNMFEIQPKGTQKYWGETFLHIDDGETHRGKNRKGYVQMYCGLHEDAYRRELTIDITDESLEEQGDFANIDMDKPELRKYIDFLEARYTEMVDVDEELEAYMKERFMEIDCVSSDDAFYIIHEFQLDDLIKLPPAKDGLDHCKGTSLERLKPWQYDVLITIALDIKHNKVPTKDYVL